MIHISEDEMSFSKLFIPGKDVPIMQEADLIISGGGPSGFGAAVVAARKGLRVILIEKYGFLGGMATAGMVGTICGMHLHHPDKIEYVIEGFAKELTDTLLARGGAFGPHIGEGFTLLLYNPWYMKRLMDEWVEKEPNITLMLHTYVADAIVESGTLKGLVLATPEGLFAVTGSIFIDSTGDAAVAHAAGVVTKKGDNKGSVMSPTMMFWAQGIDWEKYQQKGMNLMDEKIQEAIDSKKYALSINEGVVIPTYRPGEGMVKLSALTKNDQSVDGSRVSDLTYAELEGRVQAETSMEFLKNEIPGFENAFLFDTAVQIGIRETRRIVGEYVLTKSDVLSGKIFDDTICLSSWPLEIWEKGMKPRWVFLDKGFYSIPYRSLLTLNINNLMVTGRAISMDHEALSSARVMGVCIAEGQAAGTAAALALKNKVGIKEIDVEELRAEIIKDGGRLI